MFVLKNINFYVCPVCVWFRICCFSFSRIFSCIERCPWVSYKASPNQIYYFLYFLVCHHPLFQQPSRTSLLQHESRSTPRTHGATGSPGVRCRQVHESCPEVSSSSHRNITLITRLKWHYFEIYQLLLYAYCHWEILSCISQDQARGPSWTVQRDHQSPLNTAGFAFELWYFSFLTMSKLRRSILIFKIYFTGWASPKMCHETIMYLKET